VYLPDPSAATPPLGAKIMIGTGTVGLEAFAFSLNDGEPYNSGFLKIFLSTAYAPTILGAGPHLSPGRSIL
jgi:hypothetical protein